MSLADLAALGNFVSGLGVLTSLVFLYFQVRQVTAQMRLAEKSQQALIQQERYSRITETNLTIMDPVIAEAVARGMAGSPEMSQTQVSQFLSYNNARLAIAENTFLQFQNGLLGPETFAAFTRSFGAGLSSPGVRVMWKWMKHQHSAAFVAFADGLIEKGQRAEAPDMLTRWKADLATERST